MSRPDRLTTIRLAAQAPCDPRTARAWLTGAPVRGDMLRARLVDATRALGLEAPITDSQPPPEAA